mmetsp:Transcript_48223/g.96520  ORF Transcript_48223/g.96520 Transcript_48223/m.96520 type:complete len:201 (+) Transcript_48223:300-902(+)
MSSNAGPTPNWPSSGRNSTSTAKLSSNLACFLSCAAMSISFFSMRRSQVPPGTPSAAHSWALRRRDFPAISGGGCSMKHVCTQKWHILLALPRNPAPSVPNAMCVSPATRTPSSGNRNSHRWSSGFTCTALLASRDRNTGCSSRSYSHFTPTLTKGSQPPSRSKWGMVSMRTLRRSMAGDDVSETEQGFPSLIRRSCSSK